MLKTLSRTSVKAWQRCKTAIKKRGETRNCFFFLWLVVLKVRLQMTDSAEKKGQN